MSHLGADVEALAAARADRLAAEPGPRFMGLPQRWLDDPTWRCVNGHVSKRYLKSEATGFDLCLACRRPVLLTFPEDREAGEESPHDPNDTTGVS